jgi:hypothetical protein
MSSIIDDVLGITNTVINFSDSYDNASRDQLKFQLLFDDIGWRRVKNKAVSPRCIFTFIGFIYNTLNFSISISEEKRLLTLKFINDLLNSTSPTITSKFFCSMLGYLARCSLCLHAGKTYMRKLYTLQKYFKMIRVANENRKPTKKSITHILTNDEKLEL